MTELARPHRHQAVIAVTFALIAVGLLASCGSDNDNVGISSEPCNAAMAEAAAVDDMRDTVEDVDPAILACSTIDDFAAAIANNPGAVEVDARTWLGNRCADTAAPVITQSALCREFAAETAPIIVDSPSSPPVAIDPAVASAAACVEYIPIGAFVGDTKASDLWNFIGQDVAALDGLCAQLAVDDPTLIASFAAALDAYNEASSNDAAPATSSSTAPATQPPVAETPTTGAAPAPPPAGMPNVVCLDLQQAQNRIQAVTGVFYSRSVDATGAGRNQIVDSNWIVVAQDPSPGTLIGEGDAILAVVKDDEVGSLC